MEQVWLRLHLHRLSSRVFYGYEDIVEQISEAWDHFIADVEWAKNLGSRRWTKLVA